MTRKRSLVQTQPDPRALTVRREASSLAEAVVSVIEDLEAANLQPVRVCAADWLTLADRGPDWALAGDRAAGVDRTAGTGRIPPPLNPGCDTKFYSWTEVSYWLSRRMGYDLLDPAPDLVVANLLLQARRLAPMTRDREVLGELVTSYRSPPK